MNVTDLSSGALALALRTTVEAAQTSTQNLRFFEGPPEALEAARFLAQKMTALSWEIGFEVDRRAREQLDQELAGLIKDEG